MHNLQPGANLYPLASRSYANKLCPYAPKFDLKFNTRYSVLRRNSLCWNDRSDINSLNHLGVTVFLNISIASVQLKRL